MRRVQLDDAEALELLLDRYLTTAFGFARVVSRQPDLAEDVVQEAFVSLWRGRSTYPQEVEFSAWAMGVVGHRAVAAYRRDEVQERRRPDEDRVDAVAALGSTASDACSRDEAEHLRGLLAQLPGSQRDVIALARYAHLTQTDIATLLGIPVGTVKARMRRGLRQLAEFVNAT